MIIPGLLCLALQAAWTPRDLVQEYIASFNAGEARMKAYFEKYGAPNVPVATRLERYFEMKARLGRLESRNVTAQDGQTIRGRMGSVDGDVSMTFRLSADQPPKLLGMDPKALRLPAALRRPAARIQAGRARALFERRLHRARPDHRETGG
jgi:hypothetical protein